MTTEEGDTAQQGWQRERTWLGVHVLDGLDPVKVVMASIGGINALVLHCSHLEVTQPDGKVGEGERKFLNVGPQQACRAQAGVAECLLEGEEGNVGRKWHDWTSVTQPPSYPKDRKHQLILRIGGCSLSWG